MRKALLNVAGAVFLLLVAGCATPVTHYTPSGRPDVTINGRVAQQVHAEITNMMLNNSYNVKTSTETLLVFEKPMVGSLFGSRYDGTPAARVTFNIVGMENSTRVVSSFAAVTNPGSAFERLTPLDNYPDTAKYQQRLNEIKAKLEATVAAPAIIGPPMPDMNMGGNEVEANPPIRVKLGDTLDALRLVGKVTCLPSKSFTNQACQIEVDGKRIVFVTVLGEVKGIRHVENGDSTWEWAHGCEKKFISDAGFECE